MVNTDKEKVVITLSSDDPSKTLKELRSAITTTTVLIGSDEWNFHADLPEAVSALIRLQGELVNEC
jgi:hypothetical protein